MTSKKILIMVRYFIPYHISLGGVIRVLKLAEFLEQNGIEVFILTAGGEKIDYFGYEELANKLKIYYLDDFLNFLVTKRDNYGRRKVLDKVRGAYHFTFAIKKIIGEFIIPDEGVFFTRCYFKNALIIINNNGIRNIMIVSPPHSMQLVGLKLKENLGDKINLIVDYKDSWNTTELFNKHTFFTRLISEGLERKILNKADHFTYVSPGILNKINSKYFDISSKSLLVMNGYDTGIKAEVPKRIVKNKTLTIGYFGTVYANPELFFRALIKLRASVKIVIYGHADNISKKWRDEFGANLEINNWTTHGKALGFMQQMDLLLILFSNKIGADEVITGKFFEYVLAQRPILSVGPRDLAVSRIIEEKGLGYSIDLYDEEDMLVKLRYIYSKWQEGRLISYKRETFPEFSRNFQFSKLLNILE